MAAGKARKKPAEAAAPAKTGELLLELLSEEIPARMQARAADDLKRLVADGLKEAGLSFADARAFATPRRLALVVDGIPLKQPDVDEERRGPRADAPEHAIKGFKRSLPKGAKIEVRETDKGTFHFATVERKGAATSSVLPRLLAAAVDAFSWPKSMRWGSGQEIQWTNDVGQPIQWSNVNGESIRWTSNIRWVRPIRSILFLFGGKVVTFKYAAVNAGGMTTGHPFLAPKPFKVRDFADYEKKLRKAKVILDAAERRAIIEKEAKARARRAGLELRPDPALLDEVAGLVEWPVVRMGRIDEAFMALPQEVLITAMRHHQKYFALTDKRGRLAPKFIVVANTETRDGGKAVVAGNERVLSARLADAKFFWDQDRKRTLESRVQALEGRVFHAKLGSVLDKALRMEELASALAPHCGANAGDARWAARLAKADLSTEMVAEFPELQGVMGRYYARHDGENADVADAIAEHYAPQGPRDKCPKKPLSVAVALADKLDTLVGFWCIGEKPTGSKDPFALRRAALGIIRLIIENGIRLPLLDVFDGAIHHFPETISRALLSELDSATDEDDDGNVAVEVPTRFLYKDIETGHNMVSLDLLDFVADRLKVHLRDKGTPPDLIDALFAGGGEDDLLRIVKKADALRTFLGTDDGANLLVAYRRANNIVAIESRKDGKEYSEFPDESHFRQDEERALWRTLNDVARFSGTNQEMIDFEAAVQKLATLRAPVDSFFDHVTVNCDDSALRENRLRLLNRISATMNGIADFSCIEGGDR